jgi:hypothetical protein
MTLRVAGLIATQSRADLGTERHAAIVAITSLKVSLLHCLFLRAMIVVCRSLDSSVLRIVDDTRTPDCSWFLIHPTGNNEKCSEVIGTHEPLVTLKDNDMIAKVRER